MNPTFADQVKRILQYAREEAHRLGHGYIGTEHVLLGIIKDPKGDPGNRLSRLGIELTKLKQSIDSYVYPSGGPHSTTELHHTPRAKQVLEAAVEEAREMQSQVVEGDQLLLALFRDREGVACQVLEEFGVDYNAVRQEIKA